MKASGQGSVAVAKAAKAAAPTKDLTTYLLENREQIDKVKPQHLSTDRFIKIVARAVYANPTLAKCNIKSIFLAALQAAELGLEPGGVLGHAALVPYWNSKKNSFEAQFQAMYKGLLTLAHNTGMFKMIDAQVVYENDEFDYAYGLEPKLIHKPAEDDRGDVRGYYAFFILLSGGQKFEYATKADIEAWAKRYSKAYKDESSPWHQFFDEMAKKTVLRKVLKLAPLRIELPIEPEEAEIRGLTPTLGIEEEIIDAEVVADPEVEPEKEPPIESAAGDSLPQADDPVQPEIF